MKEPYNLNRTKWVEATTNPKFFNYEKLIVEMKKDIQTTWKGTYR